jgi:hypothetical protein
VAQILRIVQNKFNLFLVFSELKATVTSSVLMGKFMNGNLKPTDLVEKALYKKFVKLNSNDKMGLAARVAEKEPFFCVVQPQTNSKWPKG